jgi:phosphoglycerol transferase MdoB-like AlkP superfamily enzyme
LQFLRNIQRDFKLFLFLNIIIMIFRWVFIGVYASQLNTATNADLLATFWYGLRITLKTAGALTLPAFVFATLPQIITLKWPADGIRKFWGALTTFFLTFLFVARIPYYKIFNQSFNIMLYNGLKDDQHAILETALHEYHLLPRVALVIIVGAILADLLWRFLDIPVWEPKKHIKPLIAAFVVCFPIFFFFCRFGGAFNSDAGIHWESAARTKSNLLNEAILDDGQALYRVWSIYRRSYDIAQVKIDPQDLAVDIKTLGGNPSAPNFDEAFTRTTTGKKLPVKPKQVVVILGENYALWPLLPDYVNLGLADAAEKMKNQGAYTYHFLPAGNGTMTSLNGFLTGLAEVDLYPNYHSEHAKDIYGLGIGPLMKKAGYKTVFWYGGLSSWQDLKNFALREGFDEFHCADEMPGQGEGSWGVPDETLFAAIEKYMAQEKTPTFHFILTTTNHPPFKYDVDAKGFPRKAVMTRLPSSIPNDEETLNQLGHIWYADMEIGKFVDATKKQQPQTLFVLTGDHGERFNFATQVSLEAQSGVPCIFYGPGVSKHLLPDTMTGSHLQIMPTLCELLLPQGSKYYSLLPPLQSSNWAFNHRLVIENNVMKPEKELQNQNDVNIIKAARQVSIWRILQGNTLH